MMFNRNDLPVLKSMDHVLNRLAWLVFGGLVFTFALGLVAGWFLWAGS